MDIIIAIILFIFGTVLGSFACCQYRRIALKVGKKPTKNQNLPARSYCPHCKKQLKWYELIPIVSWLVQLGKCRHCQKPIGYLEILSELGLGIFFVVSYFLWPLRMGGSSESLLVWASFGAFLVLSAILYILLLSDAKHGKFPTYLLTFSIICAILVIVPAFAGGFATFSLASTLGGIAVLPGLYLLLYKVSREKWIGSGDWLLALALAAALADFWLCFFVVFAANLLGSLYIGVLKISKKLHQKSIPLGPFLIIAFILVFFLQDWLINLFIL